MTNTSHQLTETPQINSWHDNYYYSYFITHWVPFHLLKGWYFLSFTLWTVRFHILLNAFSLHKRWRFIYFTPLPGGNPPFMGCLHIPLKGDLVIFDFLQSYFPSLTEWPVIRLKGDFFPIHSLNVGFSLFKKVDFHCVKGWFIIFHSLQVEHNLFMAFISFY